MASMEGLEPPTYWFVASHSIQLSYKRILCCCFNQLYYNNTEGKRCQGFFIIFFTLFSAELFLRGKESFLSDFSGKTADTDKNRMEEEEKEESQ